MAVHLDLGKLGEKLAEEYLIKNGYNILYRNWRYSHYEIDIIATKSNLIHFVEVKIRTSKKFGFPEESVTKKKIKSLLNAVDEFLFRHPVYKNFHLDILSISTNRNSEPEYLLIEDVYI